VEEPHDVITTPTTSPIIEQIAICLFISLSQLMRDSHQPGFEDFGRLVGLLLKLGTI
jgi:hypothetical protein